LYFIVRYTKQLTDFLSKTFLLGQSEKGGIIHEIVSVNAGTVLVGKSQVKKPPGDLCADVLMICV